MQDLVTARVRGTFGLKGQLKIESFSGEYEHLLDLKEAFFRVPKNKVNAKFAQRDGLYQIESVEVRQMATLLKLKGIDTPEDARDLVGAEVCVPRDKASPLVGGEYYVNDLCTSVLVYEDETIGKIIGVVEGGGGWLLEISEVATERSIFVPFNAEFIGTVDIDAGKVELMHRWVIE